MAPTARRRRSPFVRPLNIVHQTMSTRMASAASASSRISHMSFKPWIAPIVGTLTACASVSPWEPGPASPPAPVVTVPVAPRRAAGAGDRPRRRCPRRRLSRGIARWVPVGYAELPGWTADRTGEAWTALQRSCERPAPAFAALCAEAATRPPPADDAGVRAWLEQRLQPYRVEALDGTSEGLATGYFEPLIDASRACRVRASGCRCTRRLRTRAFTRRAVRHAAGSEGATCAGARSPTWRTCWTRCCCRSRARGGCASPNRTAACAQCGWPTRATTARRTARWAAG